MSIKNTLICTVAALVMISRRPDALVRPQFFAEDGFLWYAQAYNKGFLVPFFEPVAGYFQTLARLGGLLAQFVPLLYAPLVMNAVALFVQLLPIALLFSQRYTKFFPQQKTKFFILISYLLLFNVQETHLNLTNAQWYLAVVALMILLVEESSSRFWWWFDRLAITLSALSGPFAIMLYPVGLLLYLSKKTQRSFQLVNILSITASLQLLAVIFTGRSSTTLIHNTSFIEILIGFFGVFKKQIVWGLLSGQTGYEWLVSLPFGIYLAALITLVSLGIIVYALLFAPLKLRLVILFAGIIFLTGTLFPTIVVPTGESSWQVLERAYGIRYWLIPNLSLLITLMWTLKKTNHFILRICGASLLMIMVLFWVKNYRFKHLYQFTPLEDFSYRSQVKMFTAQPVGTEFVIHHPPRPWSMRLEKK